MNERKNTAGLVLIIILILILLAGAAGGGILYEKHRQLKKEYQNLKDNKDSIVAAEVESRIEEVKTQEKTEMLEYFRAGLSEETNTLDFIRATYAEDYLVYARASHYLFRPILDVELADYSNGKFVKDAATGFYDYQVEKETVSKRVVDVSKYQGDIAWNDVKAYGIDGAMIRVGVRGYGSGEIVADSNFDVNMTGAIKAGLDTGVYFFTEAVTKEEAVEEAEFVLDAVKKYDLKLPVAFDLEYIEGDDGRNEKLSQEEMTEIALAFMQTIEDAGYTAMLYGNIDTISDMVNLKELSDYKLWFAYYSDDIYVPYKVDMWQYASDAKVNGITTDCDINLMFPEKTD
jgi:GH25 family lysozyme M1 (1,4-beta-N-acetylmuramidase)